MRTPLVVLAALSILVLATTRAGLARAADALQVQFSTRVAAGERPKLVLVAAQAVGPVVVELTDEAGKTVNARVPRLAAGSKHEVPLSGEPGRHRYQGQLTVDGAARPLTFETVVAPRLEVSINRARVDLAARRLEARLSRPAAKVEIAVTTLGPGAPVQTEQPLEGPAGATLEVRLPEVSGEQREIARIDLRFFDVDGFYTSVALHPWKLFIPHEEVGFATDSATIAAAERPKLEASLNLIADAFSRHQKAGPVKLYIAGHTDTVGAPEHNLRLSRARAAAIAGWFATAFRKRGLRLPILCEGFGELAPAVVTPDQTDEPRNRRVDYILAIEDPVLGGRHRPVWRPAQ